MFRLVPFLNKPCWNQNELKDVAIAPVLTHIDACWHLVHILEPWKHCKDRCNDCWLECFLFPGSSNMVMDLYGFVISCCNSGRGLSQLMGSPATQWPQSVPWFASQALSPGLSRTQVETIPFSLPWSLSKRDDVAWHEWDSKYLLKYFLEKQCLWKPTLFFWLVVPKCFKQFVISYVFMNFPP